MARPRHAAPRRFQPPLYHTMRFLAVFVLVWYSADSGQFGRIPQIIGKWRFLNSCSLPYQLKNAPKSHCVANAVPHNAILTTN